jgi:ribosomal protein L34E
MWRKIFILTIVFGGLAYFANLAVQEARRVGVNQGYEPDQPIAFSHKVHAGDNKIDCMYCHFAAEKGRHAGIPPANVCMNCHAEIKKDSPEIVKIKTAIEQNKPIEWLKVHRLPDFAYFNHSQHVTSGKVSCQDCHGPVETMTRMRQDKPLTMGWCMECHRAKGITPPEGHSVEQTKQDVMKAMGGLDCAKCHY